MMLTSVSMGHAEVTGAAGAIYASWESFSQAASALKTGSPLGRLLHVFAIRLCTTRPFAGPASKSSSWRPKVNDHRGKAIQDYRRHFDNRRLEGHPATPKERMENLQGPCERIGCLRCEACAVGRFLTGFHPEISCDCPEKVPRSRIDMRIFLIDAGAADANP